MSTAEQTLDSAISRYDSAGSLQQFVEEVGVAGILYAIFVQIIAAISAAGGVIMAPWQALGSGLANIVGTVFGSIAIIDAGAATTVASYTSGLAAWLGPLAFPAAIASFMIGIYVFMWFIQRIGFSPLQFVRNIRD